MENEKEVNIENATGTGEVASEPVLNPTIKEGVTKEIITEEEGIEEHEEVIQVDYSTFTKKQLLEVVNNLLKTNNFKVIDAILKEVKPLFDEYKQQERTEALNRFKQEGGVQDDFEFRQDETDHAFDATLKFLRDRRNQFYKNLEETKTENLRKKNEILERLRTLVDGEDSAQSFSSFKELQQEWKQVGPVPQVNSKTLWANYNALVDRFYDHRNIYFELKELDRKKNLEAKQDLCARAEKLIEQTSIKAAVKELNELHDEFKHIGPVPKDDQESLWQRFKQASDAVYAKRDAHSAEVQKQLAVNLEAKLKIIDEITAFASFATDRIKEWNTKTQEVIEIQKRWDALGPIPRDKEKEINKRFWGAFKSFFHNKGNFFKKLDEERDTNLKAKQELVKKAQELKISDDWAKTSQELINLQKQWKEIGPVPEKLREKIYKEFKDACDYFFDQRRGVQEKSNEEQEANLLAKEAIIERLTKEAAEGNATLENLHQFRSDFDHIGFVPKRAMASIKQRFEDALVKYVNSVKGLTEDQREGAILESQVAVLKGDPQGERKLFQKEQTLRKQIQKAENDIAILKNNLEFFARSKNANSLRDEFNGKIKEANESLDKLKKQLKLLKSA